MSLESFLSAFNASPVAVKDEVAAHILASWRDFSEGEYAELLEQAKAGGLSEPQNDHGIGAGSAAITL